MNMLFSIAVVILSSPIFCNAQDTARQIPLWPNGAPGFESKRNEPEQAKDYWVKNIHNPSITIYLPPKEKATGTICGPESWARAIWMILPPIRRRTARMSDGEAHCWLSVMCGGDMMVSMLAIVRLKCGAHNSCLADGMLCDVHVAYVLCKRFWKVRSRDMFTLFTF